ncbi:polyprenyl synthetase family protein [Oscillibacter sp.]|uniref:polyprenyl synthetase family protein n=1 Tax=Oscillibacter sp. TaxID=1945593 RepID=UPI002616E771|nr:farnesyl diphosphate synthase [Oscillibacter sp.]MDD3346337.1 polyprenyl synthetase family protein [Oscillibacter sp.]
MDQQAFDARYQAYLDAVEEFLSGQFTKTPHWADLYDCMRYSLLSGGKRLRPILTLEFARAAGGDWKEALSAACAVEMVHTYSLIHDDLPCMDDDALRRGKPTNHKVYGETLAVLAGDALQPAAFQLILGSGLDETARAECALLLARAAGPDGMVAGQVLDTLHAPKTQLELTEVHALKTGCMIKAACLMGCAAAHAGAAVRTAAERYAENLGLAFQIRDDMLDVVGDEAVFGKPIGSDAEEGKVTFVDLLGLEGCDKAVLDATNRAKEAVAVCDESGFLAALADSLAERKH